MNEARLLFLPCVLASLLASCGSSDDEDLDIDETISTVFVGTSLPGSIFEIDNNANFVVDDDDGVAPQRIDWLSVPNVAGVNPRFDLPTGQTDDSFKGGAKEDDVCPPTETGSIPNNKSDLLHFGTYRETVATPGDPGFLHMFWTRVTEPSGTTLMDFEFNQGSEECENGSPGRVRTIGDILIEYKIEQGGARAELRLRRWEGTAWGPEVELNDDADPTPTGVGTINGTPILAANTDSLLSTGQFNARTFGEASIDLDEFFDAGSCTTFTSVFVKSRASTSFTSQMKDFIAPIPLQLSNCGIVIIRKQTIPDGATASFGFSHDLATDPATTDTTFSLTDDGSITFTNVLPNTGTDTYVVDEDTIPSGWVLDDIDCSASTGVTVTENEAAGTATFVINDPSDVVDCTYTNRQQLAAVAVSKTRKHAASGPGDHAHAGVTFTLTGGGLPSAGITAVTDANGRACFPNLALATYTVTETVPAGYVVDGGSASKTAVATSEGDCDAGTMLPPSATVTFSNIPLTDITVSVDSQVPGGTDSVITCVLGSTTLGTLNTPASGDGSLVLTNLVPNAAGQTYTCTIFVDP